MDTTRQTYHLEPPRGLLNDPNGLCFFDGLYYAFFQWNRFAKDHTHKEWGYFTSPDLAHWTFQGSALVPDQPYDQSGVHSGSAIVEDGEMLLFYTGSDKSHGRRSSQCLATSRDGRTFVKRGVIVKTPQGYTQHFRDPKVFRRTDGSFGMVVGAQRSSGKAAIALLTSDDARTWHLLGNLGTSGSFEMTECPDLFDLGGTTVLSYCPQQRDNATDTCGESHAEWKVLPDGLSETVSLDGGSRTDLGFDFYSPQTFETPDGRRVMTAWMSRLTDEQERLLGEGCSHIHCLTLPRELSLRSGRLIQTPVRELYGLLGPDVLPAQTTHGIAFEQLGSHSLCLRVHDGEGMGDLQVHSHGDAARIAFDAATGTLALARTDWSTGGTERRTAPVGRLTSLEVWSDETSVEVFVNGGEAALSARIVPQGTSHTVTVSGLNPTTHTRLQEIDRVRPAILA